MREVEFQDLVGEHVFDGVDTVAQSVNTWGDRYENCEVMNFRLDGKVYSATEDPSDGYRSCLDSFLETEERIKNVFPGVRVLARVRTSGEYGPADILELVDLVTGKIVLEVGTENTDDYYPWFVAAFHPENMATNA